MTEKLKVGGFKITAEFTEPQGFITRTEIVRVNSGYTVKRTFENACGKTLPLKEIKTVLSGFTLGKDPDEDYYYANENARLFCTLTIPLDYRRNDDGAEENARFNIKADARWCDPQVRDGRICSGPYQPFPAILLSNYRSKKGLIFGSLCQSVFYHSFETGHVNGKPYLNVFSAFKGISEREVKHGETLTDIFYIGFTPFADDINRLFDGYTRVLREYLPDNCGSGENNRRTLIWDSWNDGIFRDVSEEMLLKEAKAVKKYFPTVEWFQLDDGYSAYCEKDVDLDAHGLGVPYEGEDGIDKVKFPNGLRSYTDKIRKIGLKPALWVGGFCPVKTKIFRERPDLFIDYTYRIDWTEPLDVSIKEARDYMVFAMNKYLADYGFTGLKHDFWSYAFEDRHDLLKNKDRSGYEYREWWQKNLRETIGDGYIGTACDFSMGNPFIGKYFNNYRYGLDVCAGDWEKVKTTMFWGLAVLSTHTGDLFVPNGDSVGLLPGLNDADFTFIVNMLTVTRTLVEISGRFSKVKEDNPRLKVLQKVTAHLNNGENVYFAEYDYRKNGFNLPNIVYINSAFDGDEKSLKTVGLFNPSEKDLCIHVTPKDIGLKRGAYAFTDVWKEKVTVTKKLSVTLAPHESRLYKVKKA